MTSKKITCKICGEELLQGNYAKHCKRKHPGQGVRVTTGTKMLCPICKNPRAEKALPLHIETQHGITDKKKIKELLKSNALSSRDDSSQAETGGEESGELDERARRDSDEMDTEEDTTCVEQNTMEVDTNIGRPVSTYSHTHVQQSDQIGKSLKDKGGQHIKPQGKSMPSRSQQSKGKQNESQLSNSRDNSILDSQFICAEVYTATQLALARSIKQLKDMIASVHAVAPRRLTRFEYEGGPYLTILARCETVHPISATQYMKDASAEIGLRNVYVACTMHEAHLILRDATPNVPLLIRAQPNDTGHRLQLEAYLDFLCTKTDIQIHEYFTDADPEEHKHVDTIPYTGEQAVALFRDRKTGPCNFLDLAIYKDNEVPTCLADLPNYSILKKVRGDGQSGKPADLTNSAAFQICGKMGVFSLPHRDHHGVLTTVTCEEGEKLWITWPDLDKTKTEKWQDSADRIPLETPFAIYLRPGDVLVQPPARVHAPYSMTDVLMTGTMHWDSRNLSAVLRHTLLEKEFENISNEEPSPEFQDKVMAIDRLWKKGYKAFDWADERDYREWSRLLLELFPNEASVPPASRSKTRNTRQRKNRGET